MAVVELLQSMYPDTQQDFVINVNETDIALVRQVPADTTGEELTRVGRTIEERLKSELFVRTTIGIGTISEHLRELADSYKEAQVAIEVGKVFDTEKTVINYENLGIGRLIYQLPTHCARSSFPRSSARIPSSRSIRRRCSPSTCSLRTA